MDTTESILSDRVYSILQYINAIDGIFLSLVGIAVNFLNIRTFLAMGANSGITVSFLSLSFSDFMASWFNLATSIALIFHAYEHYSGSLVCGPDPLFFVVLFLNLSFMAYTITILNTTYLAITRWMCVVKPLKFKNIFTARRSCTVAVVCASLTIVVYAPIFYMLDLTPYTGNKTLGCERQNLTITPENEAAKDVVYLFVLTIMPITAQVVVLVCMAAMVNILKKQSHKKFEHSTPFSTFHTASQSSSVDCEIQVDVDVEGKGLCSFLSKCLRSQHFDSRTTGPTPSEKSASRNSGLQVVLQNTRAQESLEMESKSYSSFETAFSFIKALRSPADVNASNLATSPPNLSDDESRVVRQVVLVCVLFVICNLPMIGMGLASMLIPKFDASFERDAYARLYYSSHSYSRLFEEVQSSISFFIYFNYNSKFRYQMWLYLGKLPKVGPFIQHYLDRDITFLD